MIGGVLIEELDGIGAFGGIGRRPTVCGAVLLWIEIDYFIDLTVKILKQFYILAHSNYFYAPYLVISS